MSWHYILPLHHFREIFYTVGASAVKAVIPTYCTLSTFGNERLSSHLVILSGSEESHALGTEILRYRSE